MIATSTVVMFGFMYLNTYLLDHVEFSQTPVWIALLMGAGIAMIMLGFRCGMYKNKAVNVSILSALLSRQRGTTCVKTDAKSMRARRGDQQPLSALVNFWKL